MKTTLIFNAKSLASPKEMTHFSLAGSTQILLPVYNTSVVASDCTSLALPKSWKERGGHHLGENFSFVPKVLTTPSLCTAEKPAAEMWASVVSQLPLLE